MSVFNHADVDVCDAKVLFTDGHSSRASHACKAHGLPTTISAILAF